MESQKVGHDLATKWQQQGKWYWWTHLQGRNRDADREQTCGHSKERRGWDELRVALEHIHYHIKTELVGSYYMTHGAQTWCSDNLEGWDRRGGHWREAQEGGDRCIFLADLCSFWQKPIQHCKAIILQWKISLKKQVNSEVLLSSIGNCIQYSLNHNGREKNQGTHGVIPSRHIN